MSRFIAFLESVERDSEWVELSILYLWFSGPLAMLGLLDFAGIQHTLALVAAVVVGFIASFVACILLSAGFANTAIKQHEQPPDTDDGCV